MEPTGTMQVVWWGVTIALVIGGAMYAYMEYHAFLLRTHINKLTGGMRFTSRILIVESRHATREVVIQTNGASYSVKPLAGGEETHQSGPMTVTLAAPGLRMTTASIVVRKPGTEDPIETGMSTITFNATEAMVCKLEKRTDGKHTVLLMDRVPTPIANDFQQFANRLHLWIYKLEHDMKHEIDARQKKEDDEAKRKAKAEAAEKAGAVEVFKDDPTVPMTDELRQERINAQLAAWRKMAGFAGNSREVGADDRGKVQWLIEIDQLGRAILHSGGRTFSGSLKGASVTSLTGELEISVRDDYWTEEEPELTVFRVLNGQPSDARRAWKERLEILIKGLQ